MSKINCATNQELKGMVRNQKYTSYYINLIKAEISRRGMFYIPSPTNTDHNVITN